MFRLTNEPSSGGHNCLFSKHVHMLILCSGIRSTSYLTNLTLSLREPICFFKNTPYRVTQ
jgi:hypothetical protein